MADISRADCAFILTSLRFTRDKFESYPYADYETRVGRLADVDDVITKVRALRDSLPKE